MRAAVDFYVAHLGFEVLNDFAPAFADVRRGSLRLLLSGPLSSAGRAMDDGEVPVAGGWNRIHLLVDDVEADRWPDPDRARGAFFQFDVTQVDDQQHTLSALLHAVPILEAARKATADLTADIAATSPLARRIVESYAAAAGDLDAMLARLRAAGASVDDRVEAMEGIGRFGWATDPEGNRFELWEPAPGAS